jgi:transcriptional regulator with XRE-family HTH domain
MENLVDFIRHRIDHLCMTPRQVAQKSGVDEGELSRLLSGKRRPSLLNLKRLSPILQVPLTDLLAIGGHVEKVVSLLPGLPVIPVVGEAMAGKIKPNTHLGEMNNKDLDGAKAIVIRGDSMKPLAHDGDTVVFNPSLEVKSGDYVYVKLKSHGAFFKVFVDLHIDKYKNFTKGFHDRRKEYMDHYPIKLDSVMFKSLNGGEFTPIIAESSDIEFMYKVVAVRFK